MLPRSFGGDKSFASTKPTEDSILTSVHGGRKGRVGTTFTRLISSIFQRLKQTAYNVFDIFKTSNHSTMGKEE